MNYQEFRKAWFNEACFTSNQVYSWNPAFDKNNLVRWAKKEFVVQLRNGFYTFPEYLTTENYTWYLANKIYRPSYISLHSALSFYGLIPEAALQISSVTSLKTAFFRNAAGGFSYKHVKPQLMFGYESHDINGRSVNIATPEKAIVDLLYLYPFYNSKAEMLELRLDTEVFKEIINEELLLQTAAGTENKSLGTRIKLLLETYL